MPLGRTSSLRRIPPAQMGHLCSPPGVLVQLSSLLVTNTISLNIVFTRHPALPTTFDNDFAKVLGTYQPIELQSQMQKLLLRINVSSGRPNTKLEVEQHRYKKHYDKAERVATTFSIEQLLYINKPPHSASSTGQVKKITAATCKTFMSRTVDLFPVIKVTRHALTFKKGRHIKHGIRSACETCARNIRHCAEPPSLREEEDAIVQLQRMVAAYPDALPAWEGYRIPKRKICALKAGIFAGLGYWSSSKVTSILEVVHTSWQWERWSFPCSASQTTQNTEGWHLVGGGVKYLAVMPFAACDVDMRWSLLRQRTLVNVGW